MNFLPPPASNGLWCSIVYDLLCLGARLPAPRLMTFLIHCSLFFSIFQQAACFPGIIRVG